jgi:hypothetical protein
LTEAGKLDIRVLSPKLLQHLKHLMQVLLHRSEPTINPIYSLLHLVDLGFLLLKQYTGIVVLHRPYGHAAFGALDKLKLVPRTRDLMFLELESRVPAGTALG